MVTIRQKYQQIENFNQLSYHATITADTIWRLERNVNFTSYLECRFTFHLRFLDLIFQLSIMMTACKQVNQNYLSSSCVKILLAIYCHLVNENKKEKETTEGNKLNNGKAW